MHIGEIAGHFGLPTHVLRHWETIGLLSPARASGESGLTGTAPTIGSNTGNPGQWMTHCHNVYHEAFGMMGITGYIT